MTITTDSFPVFSVRAFKKGFQVSCACGSIDKVRADGTLAPCTDLDGTPRTTDFTGKAEGLVAIFRGHEKWHRINYHAKKAAEQELAQLAEPAVVPPSDEVANHGDAIREADEQGQPRKSTSPARSAASKSKAVGA